MNRTLLPLAFLTMLGGCVSFGEKPPENLFTLRAAASASADQTRAVSGDNTLVVLPLSTPQTIATDRLAVRTGDTSIAYLKDARWADSPAKLFADLLAEAIRARTDLVVIDRRQYTLSPGARLTGQLNAFELDAGRGEVVVIFDAAYAEGEGKPLITRRFEARVTTPNEQPGTVGNALNAAANQVAAAVSDWVKSR